MSNLFADVATSSTGEANFKKAQYLKLEEGIKYTIRILEEQATKVITHFVNNSSIKCLEEDCPFCKRNTELLMQYPDSYRDSPDWRPRQKRFFVNVLDKTPVKRCECGKEYSNTTRVSCDCGKPLSNNIVPSNTVKILSKGITLFSQLNDVNSAILNQSGEPVGVTGYDIFLLVSGRGKDTAVTAIPDAAHVGPQIGDFELYDLTSPVPELSPEEAVDLSRGVSLRDIFAARRAQDSADAPVVSAETSEVIKQKVKNLFS